MDLHQAETASNLYLDGLVFFEALKAGVGRVVYASSGCVYPSALQGDPDEILYLTEDLVRPPYDSDNLYGWAKLMAELTLKALRYSGHEAPIKLLPDMPTGPMNRVADNRRADELLGWQPEVSFLDGLHQTMDWYFSNRSLEKAECALANGLTNRAGSGPEE